MIRPDGTLVVVESERTTSSRIVTDEWLSLHGYPVDPAPVLTHEDTCEAMDRLAELYLLVGHTPHEVMQMLVGVIARRDGGARYILRRLRELDAEARA